MKITLVVFAALVAVAAAVSPSADQRRQDALEASANGAAPASLARADDAARFAEASSEPADDDVPKKKKKKKKTASDKLKRATEDFEMAKNQVEAAQQAADEADEEKKSKEEDLATAKEQLGETESKESDDYVPTVSVAFKTIITLMALHFSCTVVELILSSRERGLRLFGLDPEKDGAPELAKSVSENFMLEELEDALVGMEESVAEVPLACIVIIFSHYRTVVDCGYIGEIAKKEYPTDIEMAFWLVMGVIVTEFTFVFLAIMLTLMGSKLPVWVRKFSSTFMDWALYLGQFCTIGAVAFLLYKALTQPKRAEGWGTPWMPEDKISILKEYPNGTYGLTSVYESSVGYKAALAKPEL